MARQDLITCLKNALERGYDIEQAKLSLRNAGYPLDEINLASQELQGKVQTLDVPKSGFFPKLPKPPRR
jgi:hypothetical protein